jgi:hypothetical protein
MSAHGFDLISYTLGAILIAAVIWGAFGIYCLVERIRARR